MNELQKTGIFAGAALVLAAIAALTTPSAPKAAVFQEAGQPFYPAYTSTQAVAAIEIATLSDAGATRRFVCALKSGRWQISTKWDHPADAKGQVAKTAAMLIDLKKEAVRSDNPQDHESFGVIDPTEKGTGLKGNGTRVVLRDAAGNMLCDFIVGEEVKGKAGLRYVRVPGNKRVYETKIDAAVSLTFADWVETDLLKVEAAQLRGVWFETYRIDLGAREPAIEDREENRLAKAGEAWILEGLKETETLNQPSVTEVVAAIDDLRITDVRRKTPTMVKYFSGEAATIKMADAEDMAERGFLLFRDREGKTGMAAVDGEMTLTCTDGVTCHVWFGKVVPDADGGADAKESHYLVIKTGFDEKVFPEIEAPKEIGPDGKPRTDEEKKKDQEEFERLKKVRTEKIEPGKKRERELAKRFADWFYVVSAKSHKALRKTRADLVILKPVVPWQRVAIDESLPVEGTKSIRLPIPLLEVPADKDHLLYEVVVTSEGGDVEYGLVPVGKELAKENIVGGGDVQKAPATKAATTVYAGSHGTFEVVIKNSGVAPATVKVKVTLREDPAGHKHDGPPKEPPK